MADINAHALDRELTRGSAELPILSLLDARPRHGYEVTHEGRGVLAQPRRTWDAFVETVRRVTEPEHA
jgi:DNA-binding PadR family transcriptional regulator